MGPAKSAIIKKRKNYSLIKNNVLKRSFLNTLLENCSKLKVKKYSQNYFKIHHEFGQTNFVII